jgi:hypothetical protein
MRSITDTLREVQCTFLIISLSVPLKMKTFQTKIVEKIKTHFVFSDFFLS